MLKPSIGAMGERKYVTLMEGLIAAGARCIEQNTSIDLHHDRAVDGLAVWAFQLATCLTRIVDGACV
jgi:hypothetical protein